MSTKIYDFLKKNNMLRDSFDEELIERNFLLDMEKKNTLAMLNSFQKLNNSIQSQAVLCIDAGGSNLRFSLYKDGAFSNEKKMKMFGVDKPITADEFFDLISKEIDEYDTQKVGFCFSYPSKILENKDAKVLYMTKEIKITNLEGKILGEEINKRLNKKREFSVISDTVAALLGSSSDIGMILGTGFNICYYDKYLDSIINAECGQYEKMPRGVFDIELDNLLGSKLAAEKQISGGYLALLIKIILEGFWGCKIEDFSLEDVSKLYENEGILYQLYDEEKREEIKELSDLLLKRAANRVAILVKCFAKDYDTFTIGIEGSTIYNMHGYYDKVVSAIKEIVDKPFTVVDARGKIQIGCALCV